MARREVCAGTDEQRASLSLHHSVEGWLHLLVPSDFDNEKLLADGLGCGFEIASFRHGFDGTSCIDQNSDCRGAGHQLTQQLEPLSRTPAGHERDAGDVATGPIEAWH